MKKNVRNHLYQQFYLVLAKIRINRGLLYFTVINCKQSTTIASSTLTDSHLLTSPIPNVMS